MKNKKKLLRLKRHRCIRLKMHGTNQKPRLVIHRSLKNLNAQIIDDAENKTLFSLSTLDKQIRQKFPCAGNIKAAEFFGEVFAQRAKEKGFSKIIFDRAGYLYHGRVKAFADALRKAGLEF
ncbi:MAG: 50S ribosomal protein L18 [Candidatus Omnitrophica bacterium]|nr:50S ribosomal protein L18 [Candidatus Omnitrophota bacterium]MBU4345857.1 50S ribosomal protein L18 [Candidatus Omnitrophota bacterium]MBU4473328.1 50S ribosomal protein L18 [Candidatus Omnitrophota bacterium]MCG2706623.1 50S ribosomal protein L18 [Candidatus Omnitrophota bacterium]